MAKGSQNQASVSVQRGGGPGSSVRSGPSGISLRGTSAGVALRKRRSAASSSASSTGRLGNTANMLRFYTDDAPGLKITPTVVLVMSLCFIAFVTGLHVVGKIYGQKS